MPPRRPLRVAFVTTYRPDRGNMSEFGNYLTDAAARDERLGRVEVIGNKVPGAAELEHPSERLTVRRMWQLGSAASLEKLVWDLRRLKPDVVHLNAGIRTWGKGRAVSFVGAALAAQLRLAGLKTVTTLHHIGETMRFDDSIDTTLKLDRITKLGMKAASALYLKADVVTVMLGMMQRVLRERFGAHNVAHLPHGTFGARVHAPPEPPKLQVLCFGFWGAFKDADLLVQAVSGLRQKGLPVELVLGGGRHPYFPEIYDSMVKRYTPLGFVRFTGYVPEEKIGDVFTQSSVVVLPYRTNSGASGVLNLARSYGCPAVISNDPALLEQVRHEGGSAMVFNDVSSLEDGLGRVLSDAALRRQMGEANLAVARQQSIETQARRLVGIFQQLAAGERPTLPQSPILTEGYLAPLPLKGTARLYAYPVPAEAAAA